MEIDLAVAKINKFSSPESGDTLEVIERPGGGISVVLADGQYEHQSSKSVSSKVVHTAISLLMEGIRDGAAARAASDNLYIEYNGKALAYMNIISVDLQTNTIVLLQNNPLPIYIVRGERIDLIQRESTPIGTSRNIRPSITEIPLESGLWIIMHTLGIHTAGKQYNQEIDIPMILESMFEDQEPSAKQIADTLISEAIRLDHGRPWDDMSVVVLQTSSRYNDNVRRLTIRLPVEKTANDEDNSQRSF